MNVDCIVIGGGVVGLSSAYYLQKSGLRVLVLDKGNRSQACSFANGGLIVPRLASPLSSPQNLKEGLNSFWRNDQALNLHFTLDFHYYSWLIKFATSCSHKKYSRGLSVLQQMAKDSWSLYHEWLDNLEDFAWQERGLLSVYRQKQNFQKAEKEEPKNSEIYAAKDLPALGLNSSLAGGFYHRQQAQVEPERVLASLRASLATGGTRLLENIEVFDFNLKKEPILYTNAGTFKSHKLVIAAGVWSVDLFAKLGIKLPLQAAKGYSLTSNIGAFPMPIVFSEAHIVVTPFSNFTRYAGGLDLCGLDDSVSWLRLKNIHKTLKFYLVNVPPLEAFKIWRGLRPCSPDGLPIISSVKSYDNVFVCTGHAMLGMSLAPISGKVLADLVNFQDGPDYLSALSLTRFM